MLPDDLAAACRGDLEDGRSLADKDPQPPAIAARAMHRPPRLVGMDLVFGLIGTDTGVIPRRQQRMHPVQRPGDRARAHGQAGEVKTEPLAVDREAEEKLLNHELGQKGRRKEAFRNWPRGARGGDQGWHLITVTSLRIAPPAVHPPDYADLPVQFLRRFGISKLAIGRPTVRAAALGLGKLVLNDLLGEGGMPPAAVPPRSGLLAAGPWRGGHRQG